MHQHGAICLREPLLEFELAIEARKALRSDEDSTSLDQRSLDASGVEHDIT